MKKLKGKEFILLSLPILALLGFSLYLPKTVPKISFGSAQVAPIPLRERNRYNPFSPDTRLRIDVLRPKPFLLNRLWQKRANSIRYKPGSIYLLDAKGRKYTSLKDYGGSSYVSNTRAVFMPADGSGISYTHEFHLAQIPVSAGKVTFKATYIADNGFQLPVSIVVRP